MLTLWHVIERSTTATRVRLVASLAVGLTIGAATCFVLVFLAWCFPSLAVVNTAVAGPGGIPPPMIFVSERTGMYAFPIAATIFCLRTFAFS